MEVITYCPKREGTKGCPWYVTGCLNPEIKPEVKWACSKTERLKRGKLYHQYFSRNTLRRRRCKWLPAHSGQHQSIMGRQLHIEQVIKRRHRMDSFKNLERHRLSDGGLAIVNKLGRTYSFTRTYNSLTIPPDVTLGVKKAVAYKLLEETLKRDVLETE